MNTEPTIVKNDKNTINNSLDKYRRELNMT